MPETPNLVTLTTPASKRAEAYHTLQANLAFAAIDEAIETLVVAPVASVPANGVHQEVAANLAVALAQVERETILVDADLRQPKLQSIFGLENQRGLVSMIAGDIPLNTPPLATVDVPGLSVLPSGPQPPNPLAALSSRTMERIVDSLKERADVVVFAAPPVTEASDATVLGTYTDGLLLIAYGGHTRRNHIHQARELLKKAQVRLVGAVLKDAPGSGVIVSDR